VEGIGLDRATRDGVVGRGGIPFVPHDGELLGGTFDRPPLDDVVGGQLGLVDRRESAELQSEEGDAVGELGGDGGHADLAVGVAVAVTVDVRAEERFDDRPGSVEQLGGDALAGRANAGEGFEQQRGGGFLGGDRERGGTPDDGGVDAQALFQQRSHLLCRLGLLVGEAEIEAITVRTSFVPHDRALGAIEAEKRGERLVEFDCGRNAGTPFVGEADERALAQRTDSDPDSAPPPRASLARTCRT